ncbi:MAG: oxidoreductase [Chitinophagaceae bacterium]
MKRNKILSTKIFFALTLLLTCFLVTAQRPSVEVQTSGNGVSLRGLSVVNDNVIWVSGNKGTVGRSNNSGKTWKWMTVTGFEKNDFRDIEAFDGATAIIMAVDAPAYILKTTDGGETWKVVYENKTKGMFLDAMEFWNEQAGIIVGDPIDGRFFVTRTFDGGNTWQDIPFSNRPVADSGEACFAASGTNIRSLDRDEAVFVSGGKRARLFIRNSPMPLPIIQGQETTGANSIAVWDKLKLKGGKRMIVVGGDFNKPESNTKNCYYTMNGGKSWEAPNTPPHGYRSCVEYFSKTDLYSCGLTGVDYTHDGGKNWKWISKESFHVVRASKLGAAIFLAGTDGKIGKIVW